MIIYKIAMAADVINRGAGSVSVGLFDEDEQSFVASATGSVKSQQVVPDLEIPVGFTVRLGHLCTSKTRMK